MNPFERLREQNGQALAIVALAMTTLLLAIGLTIDGGNAFAQQRATQNGSDASSLAGAVKLGNYAACAIWTCAAPTDGDVSAAVNNAATQNSITITAAYYTDVCGFPLKTDGTAARTGGGPANLAVAAKVGAGIIPPDRGGTPNCATNDTGPTRGVLVLGHRSVGTFMVGMAGINTWEIETQSTAVSTYGACAASQGCGFLPIAFPVNITSCDGSGKAVDMGSAWQLYTIYVFPLCKKDPGNVGWLDLNGEGKPGLPNQILHPSNSPITSPSWQPVGLSGNPNNPAIDAAIWTLDGLAVRALQYDHTCPHNVTTNSSIPTINTGPNYGCASGIDTASGGGISYRLQTLGFKLCSPTMAGCPQPHGSYTHASNKTQCGGANGGDNNGMVGCIIGEFVNLADVPGAGFGGSDGTSPVQLIK